jgi:uncharacterized protein GlcG (DUF336 family)
MLHVLAVFLLSVALHSPTVLGKVTLGGLELDEARSVLQAGLNANVALFAGSVRQCIVVLDVGGNLKAGLCIDGAPGISSGYALQKARTALGFGQAYEQATPLFAPGQGLYHFDNLVQGKYTPIGGALPLILPDGTVYGAVGVSGAPTSDQDLSVANASLAGLGSLVTASNLRFVAPFSAPRLIDAIERLAAAEQQAMASHVNMSLAIYSDAAMYLGFYRMDQAPLATVDLAVAKALSAVKTQMNTSALFPLAQPSSSAFSFDGSNGGLSVTPGGYPLYNTQGALVGSVACASGIYFQVDEAVCQPALSLSRPSFAPLMASSVSQATANAVLSAGFASAQSLGYTACIAVVGLNTVIKSLVCGTGVPPAGADQAVAKARTVVYLPFPGNVLNAVVRPGAYYGLADALQGLVVYSGLSALFSPSGELIGGVGVFSEGPLDVDDTIVAAAAAAAARGATASSISLPNFSPVTNIDPIGLPYYGAGISGNDLLSLCARAMTASARPSVCTGRDGTGSLRVVVAADGVPAAAVDLSAQLSLSSFVYPHSSGAFQITLSPFLNMTTGEGMYYTSTTAFPTPFVAVAGGRPLQHPLKRSLVGSLAISSGLSNPLADDTACGVATSALPTLYSGDPICPTYSSLTIVNSYLAALFSGDIATATSYTAGANFTFSWHGPQDLIPIAGVYYGANALATFSGNVFRLVKDFTLNPDFAPATGGVRTVAAQCDTIVKQWQEMSVVIATGKPISKATNTVVYVVKDGLIQTADVWVDSMQYAQAFCAGSVACAALGPSQGSTVTDSCSSDTVLQSVRGFGATNLALLILVIALLLRATCFAGHSARRGHAETSGGVPYVSMS